MISEALRRFIEGIPLVYVASADAKGCPHLAAGNHLTVSNESLLVFENWFCPVTLHNIACNSHVAVVLSVPGSTRGYQLLGRVVKPRDDAVLEISGHKVAPSGTTLALTRFMVKVEKIMEFSTGVHFDIPIDPNCSLDLPEGG
ncbi:pyridoxamine 5'-phosphate oxidase family protein [Geobacter sp. AOG2]|uniref:pyridoxamine 5'-phosphate oxidase family protein n=1 Tax=Geobacter sp. AOG2 TaxID=1566347 RepID=UPI001CC561C6|nr:pyridoxamine 5'-phosphate oxidase family protein [Geobacter sp. AOG2]GFE60542.1 hypothetical protein AOG2_11300 [Geobacter sp. AOG2]